MILLKLLDLEELKMNNLTKFLITFIPVKKWRTAIRYFERNSKFEFFDIVEQHLVSEENVKVNGDIVSVFGINFKKQKNLTGLIECFFRRDYEFGGVKDFVFIDVGANIGDSALYTASNPNCKKVFSYEPFFNTYKTALTNINLNPDLKEKINIFNFGWGGEEHQLEVECFEDSYFNTLNSANNFPIQAKIHTNKTKTIVNLKKSSDELKKILSLFPDSNIVLKIDIEGGEYECIQDLDNSGLLKYINVIFLEWHYKGYKEFSEIFAKNNFVWFHSKPISPEFGSLTAVNKNRTTL